MFKNPTHFGKSFSLVKTAQKVKEQVMPLNMTLALKIGMVTKIQTLFCYS